MNKFLIFSVLVGAFSLTSVDAQASYCYTCTSCASPFDYSGNSSCSSGSNTCMKTYIAYPNSLTTLFSGNITTYISRACVPSSACSAMSMMIAGYGISTTCCTTNLCNSAESTKVKVAALYFPLLATLIYL